MLGSILKIGAVIGSWLTPKRSIARKRLKIGKLEDELKDLIENQSATPANKQRVADLQLELSRLHKELEVLAS